MSRTGRGLLVTAVVLVAVGLLVGLVELVAVGVAAGLVLLVALMWSRRRDVEVLRTVEPVRVERDGVALARVSVHNRSDRLIPAARFEERIGDEVRVLGLGRIKPGRTRSATYRLPTDRRAVLQLGPGALRYGDPFGVLEGRLVRGRSTVFYVHPRRHALRGFPRSGRRAIDGPEAQQAALGSMVFHQIRDYVPGDDPRHIHWRSSARNGSLMVRQFVDPELPEVSVVLDVRADAYEGDSFEDACEAVASLTSALHTEGFKVRFLTSAGLVVEGTPDSPTILDLLAGLHTVPDASLLGSIGVAGAGRRAMAVVIVTGRAGETTVRFANRLSGGGRTVVLAEIRRDAGATMPVQGGGLQLVSAVDGADFARAWNEAVHP